MKLGGGTLVPVFLERPRATHQFLGNYVVGGDEYQIALQALSRHGSPLRRYLIQYIKYVF